MKNTVRNIGLWVLAAFMFLFAVYAVSAGGIVGAVLLTGIGIFISPLRTQIFNKLNLPSLKGIYITLISLVLFFGALISIPTTSDTSINTIKELNNQVEAMRLENDSLITKNFELNDELVSNEKSNQTEQEELRLSLNEKDEQIKNQENIIVELQEQLNQIDDYQSQIDNLTAENNNLKNEVSNLQQANAKASTESKNETAISSTTTTSSDNLDIDDITVYITKTGEKYHSGGCRYLSRSKIPILKSDAINQGYGACSVCSP